MLVRYLLYLYIHASRVMLDICYIFIYMHVVMLAHPFYVEYNVLMKPNECFKIKLFD